MAKYLHELPLGTVVKDPNTKYLGEPIRFVVAAQSHVGYPASSTTLLSEKVISVKAFDGKEPDNPLNLGIQKFGHGRYDHSNIRQWLNKSGTGWFTPQSNYDKPPTTEFLFEVSDPYESEPAFLSGFSNKFKEKLMPTTLKFILQENPVSDPYTKHDKESFPMNTVVDKVFLLSATEVNLSGFGGSSHASYFEEQPPARGREEGYPLAYTYESTAQNIALRTAYPTQAAINAAPKFKASSYADGLSVNQTMRWFLRTPDINSPSGNQTFGKTLSSPARFESSSISSGIRPALNLPNITKVKATPEADGSHIITFNVPPTVKTIPAQQLETGKSSTLKLSAYFSDVDNDTLSYVVTSSSPSVVNASESAGTLYMSSTTVGKSTITIKANDGQRGEVSTSFVVTVADPVVEIPGPESTGIPSQSIRVGEPKTLTLSNYFTSPSGAALTYKMESNDKPSVVTAQISGATLTLNPLSVGTAFMYVQVLDSNGKGFYEGFSVSVSAASSKPITYTPIPNQTSNVGINKSIMASTYFSSENPITYTVSSEDSTTVGTAVSGATITLIPKKVGATTILVTAKSGDQYASLTFTFTVTSANLAPVVTTIPNQSVAIGSTVRIRLADYFTDPNGDVLTYIVSSSDTTIVQATVSGGVVELSGKKQGNSTITVFADDGKGGKVNTSFNATTSNSRPVVTISTADNKVIKEGDIYRIEGTVMDPNVGDQIEVFFVVASNGSPHKIATLTATGSAQPFNFEVTFVDGVFKNGGTSYSNTLEGGSKYQFDFYATDGGGLTSNPVHRIFDLVEDKPKLFVNVNGVDKAYDKGFVNVNGVYKVIESIHDNVNGVWKKA